MRVRVRGEPMLLYEAEALLHVPALLRPTHLEAVVAVLGLGLGIGLGLGLGLG